MITKDQSTQLKSRVLDVNQARIAFTTIGGAINYKALETATTELDSYIDKLTTPDPAMNELADDVIQALASLRINRKVDKDSVGAQMVTTLIYRVKAAFPDHENY